MQSQKIASDYINIISLSLNEESSKLNCEKLTNSKADDKGTYRINDQGLYFQVIPRWLNHPSDLPHLPFIDAIILDVKSEKEYNDLSTILQSYKNTHLIIILSDCDDLENESIQHLNAKILSKSQTSVPTIINYIASNTLNHNMTIRKIFNSIDTNKNGFLEKQELINFARDTGENVSSQEFNDAMKAIDKHDLGKICYEDFEIWWKMGGHTSTVFGKLIKLSRDSRNILISDDQFQKLQTELDSASYTKEKCQYFLQFYNKNFSSPGLQLFLNLCIGGKDKEMAVSTYKLRNSNKSYAKDWFQISIKVKNPNNIDKIMTSIINFRDYIIKNANRNMANFIHAFFKIDDQIINDLIVMTFNVKMDLQHFFENAIHPIITFFDLFTCSEDSTSQILVDFEAENNLDTIFSNNLNISKAFESYKLEIKGNFLRNKLRTMINSFFNDDGLNKLVWYATASNSFNVKSEIEIENLVSKEKDFKLGFLKEMLDFYISKFHSFIPFLNELKSVEVGINFNKAFLNLRFTI